MFNICSVAHTDRYRSWERERDNDLSSLLMGRDYSSSNTSILLYIFCLLYHSFLSMMWFIFIFPLSTNSSLQQRRHQRMCSSLFVLSIILGLGHWPSVSPIFHSSNISLILCSFSPPFLRCLYHPHISPFLHSSHPRPTLSFSNLSVPSLPSFPSVPLTLLLTHPLPPPSPLSLRSLFWSKWPPHPSLPLLCPFSSPFRRPPIELIPCPSKCVSSAQWQSLGLPSPMSHKADCAFLPPPRSLCAPPRSSACLPCSSSLSSVPSLPSHSFPSSHPRFTSLFLAQILHRIATMTKVVELELLPIPIMLKSTHGLLVRDWKEDVVQLVQFPRTHTIVSPSPFALKLETWIRMNNIKYHVIN